MDSIKDIIQNRTEFNTVGISADLTEDEILNIQNIYAQYAKLEKELKELENRYQKIKINATPAYIENRLISTGKKFQRKRLALDDLCSPADKRKLFSHDNQKLWFLNTRDVNKLGIIDDANLGDDNDVYLTLCLDVYGKHKKHITTLDRFLYYILDGTFIFKNKNITNNYLYPSQVVVKEQKELLDLQQEINKKIKALNEFIQLYNNDIVKFDTLQRENNSKYFQIKSQLTRGDDPKEVKKLKTKVDKAQSELRTIWNTSITKGQQAYVIGWICKHIRRITIKVVDQGVSDQLISAAYPDNIYGAKYKERSDTAGWDAPSGILSLYPFTTIPSNELKYILSKKFSDIDHLETATATKHRIENLDFCLFLLEHYNKYGFISGKGNLRDFIDIVQLREKEFPNNLKEFDAGYSLE